MAKPNHKVKKAFALSAIVGALLMSSNNGDPKLTALKVQINKAMQVFSFKARREYYVISDYVQDIWVEMAEEHNNSLDEDEISVFIEMVLSLIPPQEMKKYLGMQFKTTQKLRDSKKSSLLMTLLALDRRLNEYFGTTATATRESLGLVMVKPVKKASIKKQRDKAKPVFLKKLRNRAKWNRERLRT